MWGTFFTILLLLASNVFMTFAWYYHLREEMTQKPLYFVILFSWGIAFFEYVLQVPANRLGASVGLQPAQLKIIQEVITLAVFVPFAVIILGAKMRLDFLWAALCMLGAVYFVFRSDGKSTEAPTPQPANQEKHEQTP
jgi:uncharacterized protein (DUF486 family)